MSRKEFNPKHHDEKINNAANDVNNAVSNAASDSEKAAAEAVLQDAKRSKEYLEAASKNAGVILSGGKLPLNLNIRRDGERH